MKRLLFTSFVFGLLCSCNYSKTNTSQDKETQDDLPVVKTNVSPLSIMDGNEFKKDYWDLAPEVKPQVYNVLLMDDKPRKVTFYTDIDSISFEVVVGKSYDFIIQWSDKLCYQRLVGKKIVSEAKFIEEYKKSRQGKIFVDIPKAYELLNIAIAESSVGIEEPYLVYKKSDYYKKVRDWFDQYRKHEFVQIIDSILGKGLGYYPRLEANGYSFAFDENNQIQWRKVFDQTRFGGRRTNSLVPYLAQMQSFADVSEFVKFYDQNVETYTRQINFYRDSIDIPEMQNWLEKNFPNSHSYDTYNILFSPLVAYNQSSTWFQLDGFKELQPHVNFPYRRDIEKLLPLSKTSEYIYRGNIVFTEINHGYINPEAGKYSGLVRNAISNRSVWVSDTETANYYRGQAIFNEYMNWALVCLRIIDYVPTHEQDKLITQVENMMVKNRGFIKFRELDHFLIDIYKNRNEGTTVADLYPKIIDWFINNNKDQSRE